ncbi:unnamed protein product [Lactuca saligna]|uniref:Uncharacterized protein n=1 Tax=Lactuca saligna TaxID=75948 RepID=A0AA36EAI3_LACSI|nr:unnamed protein product [Lactuca saligna]
MDVHEALDKARAEKERLEEEVRKKTDLYNNLRKAQIEMVTKFQETKLQSEKQAKELNARSEEMICKLEEKLRDVEDQLKWKNEQFQHLEEAHERLQESFRCSKSEWEKEKSLLLDEISSVQRSLDAQIRISETLQTQLKICNQALAHEQSSKKLLEFEVSEYKSRFDSIYLECHEAKATIEKLSHKRDEEVAELRDTLATKDSQSKEMGYKMVYLEQENQELTASLKEFQESQIVKSGPTASLKKLQRRYQDLEQIHKKCKENLEEKEVEWKSQMEKKKKEMDEYLSKLKLQNEQVKQLQEELENSKIQNLRDVSDDLSHKFIEIEKEKQLIENQSMLLETSLKACKIENQSLLCKANEKNEKIVDLQHQVVLLETLVTERTGTIEAQKKDIEKYFKIIQDKESSLENVLIGFEQEKKSLLEVLEERNKRIEEVIEEMTNAFKNSEEKQIENDLIHHALEKMEIEVSNLCEKMKVKDESLLQASQHAEELQVKKLEKQIEIDVINQALEKLKIEVSDLSEKMKVKDESLFQASQHAEELQVKNLEKQIEIDVLNQALEKLKIEVSDLSEKMKLKDESLLQAEELQVLLGIKKLETEKLKELFEDEKRQLEAENQGLREDIKKLLSHREDLISQMETMSEQMGEFSKDDEFLMGMLDNMLQKSTLNK